MLWGNHRYLLNFAKGNVNATNPDLNIETSIDRYIYLFGL